MLCSVIERGMTSFEFSNCHTEERREVKLEAMTFPKKIKVFKQIGLNTTVMHSMKANVSVSLIFTPPSHCQSHTRFILFRNLF